MLYHWNSRVASREADSARPRADRVALRCNFKKKAVLQWGTKRVDNFGSTRPISLFFWPRLVNRPRSTRFQIFRPVRAESKNDLATHFQTSGKVKNDLIETP
jgi:hypothetical protein